MLGVMLLCEILAASRGNSPHIPHSGGHRNVRSVVAMPHVPRRGRTGLGFTCSGHARSGNPSFLDALAFSAGRDLSLQRSPVFSGDSLQVYTSLFVVLLQIRRGLFFTELFVQPSRQWA